jgi:hypothetical protein
MHERRVILGVLIFARAAMGFQLQPALCDPPSIKIVRFDQAMFHPSCDRTR